VMGEKAGQGACCEWQPLGAVNGAGRQGVGGGSLVWWRVCSPQVASSVSKFDGIC
jgi:hypothetical protein